MSKPSTAAAAEKHLHPRLARELKTVQAMIRFYCRAVHRASVLCEQCAELSDYAERRLTNCPFQEHKATCGTCAVHCYKPEMRQKIIEVMKFSGPRMMFRHPFLATAHLIDEKWRHAQAESAHTTIQKRKRP